jgi:hypothetical protein
MSDEAATAPRRSAPRYAEKIDAFRYPHTVDDHPVCFLCGRILTDVRAMGRVALSRVGNAAYSCRTGQGCRKDEPKRKARRWPA